jgi:hypothetical protein
MGRARPVQEPPDGAKELLKALFAPLSEGGNDDEQHRQPDSQRHKMEQFLRHLTPPFPDL